MGVIVVPTVEEREEILMSDIIAYYILYIKRTVANTRDDTFFYIS